MPKKTDALPVNRLEPILFNQQYPIPEISASQSQADEFFTILQRCLQAALPSSDQRQPIFQFDITAPESHWVVDFEHATILEGRHPAAVTISISDSDLGELIRGVLQVHDLYMHGKLRVDGDFGGDFGCAHRLQFLTVLLQS